MNIIWKAKAEMKQVTQDNHFDISIFLLFN